MQWRVIQRLLGLFLMLFSSTLLLPLLLSVYFQDGTTSLFLQSFVLLLCVGAVCFLSAYRANRPLRLRDGFLIVVLFWLVLGLAGSLPLYLAAAYSLNDMGAMTPMQAIFESISGLTTTGATVLTDLDSMPRTLLFYRQSLQWLGGMGIIVLAVAVLPMLGIGGVQLYRAETCGAQQEDRITPRIAETAKALWYIYVGLTVACALGYLLAGMSLFDAISYAFSTVSIGGFSPHDESIGYFQSDAVQLVASLFMLLSGASFILHFTAVRQRRLRPYWRDSEFRAYIFLLVTVMLITVLWLGVSEFYTWDRAIVQGIFHAVSIGTTSGFTTVDYVDWPVFLPWLLLLFSFVGGCAGSTGGGMKVIRILLLLRQGQRELRQLIHPSAQLVVKLSNRPISARAVNRVWGFFAAYIFLFAGVMLALLALGIDPVSAFSAVAACMNNLGPGLGVVAVNYAALDDAVLAMLSVAMLLGRLEIFTLLVLFTPTFWRN